MDSACATHGAVQDGLVPDGKSGGGMRMEERAGNANLSRQVIQASNPCTA